MRRRFIPERLSQRFALAAALLVVVALALGSIASFWIIEQQRAAANEILRQRALAADATAVGNNLRALATRMAEVAGNPILATGLVDSAGRETYLAPYLQGLRQVNGIPVQAAFTDFEATPIADNGAASFSPAEFAWLRQRIDAGDERSAIRQGEHGAELVGVALLRYSRTRTPEGALMYKVALADLAPAPHARLGWSGQPPAAAHGARVAAVPAPPAFSRLGLVLSEDQDDPSVPLIAGGSEHLLGVGIMALLALGMFVLGSRTALGLTEDLRRLEAFANGLGGEGISQRRASEDGSAEVRSLARSLNHMLDQLYRQHLRLESERHKFVQLTDSVPQLVWVAAPDGTVTWFNERWYAYTGLPRSQDGAAGWEAAHDPAELPRVQRRWRQALESGSPVQLTFPLRGADGRFRSFFTSVAPLKDAAGAIVQWVGTCTDVSQLELAEQAVRQSEERLQQGLVAARMAVWEWDPGSGRIGFQANLHSVFGAACHAIDDCWQLVDGDDRDTLRARVDAGLREHGAWHLLARIHRPGEAQPAWIDMRGDLAPDGGMLRAVAIDVSARQRAVEALRAADRQKDEFLAMLGHELRNPLAPISGAADMLKLLAPDDRKVARAAEIIARQVGHMRRLLEDLLDVSRVTRGLVEVAREPVDLRAVLAEAAEQVRPLAGARRHALQLDVPATPVVVEGDHTRLVQVAANILTNAAKYTPEGGRIEARVALDAGEALLSVRDNGVGIGPELMPTVFELFTQAERTLDRSHGGLGLGLALVKRLVELHGGSVQAESAGPGAGSTFTVRLPLLAAA